MPTEKPLPDDIIELTDFVEAGKPGGAPDGDDAPVDMSFEQELDDLFGDVEPSPPKQAPAKAEEASPADEGDLIDLTDMMSS